MNFLNTFASLFSNFGNLTWQMVVMWGIGALLIYLAIAKKMEPSLLLPMGFGAILVNLPLSGAITQGDTVGPISALFEAGMSNELFPLLLPSCCFSTASFCWTKACFRASCSRSCPSHTGWRASSCSAA